MIEWITIKGFDETFDDIDDLWTESRHKVFRLVQNHTHSAMLHFYSPTLPDLAVRSFMVKFKFIFGFCIYLFLDFFLCRRGCIVISDYFANRVRNAETIY